MRDINNIIDNNNNNSKFDVYYFKILSICCHVYFKEEKK